MGLFGGDKQDEGLELADVPAGEMPGDPIKITDGNLDDALKRFNVVVVDCWAPWCGPCKMLAPTIHDLAREMKGKVVFGKLNTDANQQTAMKFGIMSIPTLLVFKDGNLVDQLVGAMPKASLETALGKYMD